MAEGVAVGLVKPVVRSQEILLAVNWIGNDIAEFCGRIELAG
mgnify:CR=1 FL=1